MLGMFPSSLFGSFLHGFLFCPHFGVVCFFGLLVRFVFQSHLFGFHERGLFLCRPLLLSQPVQGKDGDAIKDETRDPQFLCLYSRCEWYARYSK